MRCKILNEEIDCCGVLETGDYNFIAVVLSDHVVVNGQ